MPCIEGTYIQRYCTATVCYPSIYNTAMLYVQLAVSKQLHLLLVYSVHSTCQQVPCNITLHVFLLQQTSVDRHGNSSCKGEPYFNCKDGHAVFVVLSGLLPDQRHRKEQSSGDSKPCNRSLLLQQGRQNYIDWQ